MSAEVTISMRSFSGRIWRVWLLMFSGFPLH
jgi:hypothetical protein